MNGTLILCMAFVCCSALHAQTRTFASRIGSKVYLTRIPADQFKETTPASLFKDTDGKTVWAVEATVTLEEASAVAIKEAKRLLGDLYGTEWTLREAGKQVSGSQGRYLHHYRFEFQPKRVVAENLQVIITLDGKLIPATRNR